MSLTRFQLQLLMLMIVYLRLITIIYCKFIAVLTEQQIN